MTGLLLMLGLTACADALIAPEMAGKSLSATPVSNGISVSPSTPALFVDGTVQLEAYDSNQKLIKTNTWSSDNTAVATVSSSGLVTGRAAGVATITARANKGRWGTAVVSVTAVPSTIAPVVASVEVSSQEASVEVGATTQLQATVKDNSGATMPGASVVWSSSDPAVATVDPLGKITAMAPGSATIRATADGKSGTAAVTVREATVPEPPPPSPDFAAIKGGIRPRGFGAAPYSLLQPAAGGIMYWVSPNGNDTNPGTSTQPFRTINRAAQVAVAGDVVTIRDGTYQESVLVRNSGTADKRIVFQAERRSGVVLTGGTHVFQPHGWQGVIDGSPQRFVTVRGLIFRAYAENVSGKHALRTARGWIVDDCLFDNSGYTGIQVNDHDVTVVRTTMQYHYAHAYIVSGGGGGTNPQDPAYRPIERFRLIDSAVMGNHTTEEPLTGALGTSVAKIGPSRWTLIENVESYSNNGAGLWLDEKSSDYTIRNNYIHNNSGRGMYIEKNWAGGLIESNVILHNLGPAVSLVNSNGLVIQNNLFAHNDQCVNFVNVSQTTTNYELFVLKDIRIFNNSCKDWARWSGIHAMGGEFTTPWEMNIFADGNMYEPVRAASLSWWPDPIRAADTITQSQSKFRWETNGRISSIAVP